VTDAYGDDDDGDYLW